MNMLLTVFLCLFIAVGVSADEEGADTANFSDTLVILYMVGSDLETEYKAGTMNLAEMMDGYGDARSEDLEIIIAYGGSKTPGWEGITYTTITSLMEDAEDGVIGNYPDVLYSDPDADMSSRESLEKFLRYVTENYASDRKMLFFWNHGSGYDGFGMDEITENMLSLGDISNALQSAGMQYDIIGFDACLMGGIEVASAMAPYGTWLIASAETEPGSGWHYENWVKALASDPQIPALTLGTMIIDDYMEREETAKTLALINLSEIDSLVSGLNTLGDKLIPISETIEGYRSLGKTYQVPARFGVDNRERGETSVDLVSFLKAVQTQIPDAEKEVGFVIDQIDKVVVYYRNDDYVPESGGISIMSPSRISPERYSELGDDVQLTPGWDSFFYSLLKVSEEDTEKPHFIKQEQNIWQIDDPFGTADVWAEYYHVEDGRIVLLGEEPVAPDDDGYYQLPDWDGRWFYLEDNLDPENYALMSMSYDSTVPEGSIQFLSEIELVRGSLDTYAVLSVFFHPDSGEIRLSATPYSVRENGEVQFSRQNLVLSPGDLISTYAWEMVDDDTEDGEWVLIGEMKYTEDSQVVYDILPDGEYAQALFAGYGNNMGDYTEIRIITIENGEPISYESITESEDVESSPDIADLTE